MAAGTDVAWPEDAVEVGSIAGAWGIKGWIKVLPYAADPQALFATRNWFLKPAESSLALPQGGGPRPLQLTILQLREHGDGIVAQALELADRNAAEAIHGSRIFVSRRSFPSAEPDEYYWVDLIGLAVSNRQGEPLGSVVGLIDTGPHSVLRVAPVVVPAGKSAQEAERLIPFVAAYVDSVSLHERLVVVDWGLDY